MRRFALANPCMTETVVCEVSRAECSPDFAWYEVDPTTYQFVKNILALGNDRRIIFASKTGSKQELEAHAELARLANASHFLFEYLDDESGKIAREGFGVASNERLIACKHYDHFDATIPAMVDQLTSEEFGIVKVAVIDRNYEEMWAVLDLLRGRKSTETGLLSAIPMGSNYGRMLACILGSELNFFPDIEDNHRMSANNALDAITHFSRALSQ